MKAEKKERKKNTFPISPTFGFVCVCNEEQFTTRRVENLVEIVKNFNDTTGFIFSTACAKTNVRNNKKKLKKAVKSSLPLACGRCSLHTD